MNLSRLFWQDREADLAAERAKRDDAQHELYQVNAMLDLFNVPLWGYIKDTLDEVEESSTNALVSGTASAEGAAERIKLARHLKGLQDGFLADRARLEDTLKEEETW